MSPDDRAAVRWLSDQNAMAGQRLVIAEAAGDEYSFASRMATYSGAVGVMGWAGHELQWRGPLAELSKREGDLAALYRDALPDGIRPILDRYGVRYVVVGDIERQRYGDQVDTRFDNILPLAVRIGNTRVYRAR
jgi:uncharacterized membrane protein